MDYEQEFKMLASADSFVSKWPNTAGKIRRYCDGKFQAEIHTQWCTDVEHFLLLLKLLPPTKRGPKIPFARLTDKLIVFKVVGRRLFF